MKVLSLILVVVMLFCTVTVFATADAVLPFTDVKKGSWYHAYVSQVYEEGLMEGKSETVFAPLEAMTRA